MFKDGKIIEHGSFKELMRLKGHLASLVGEHVEILKDTDDYDDPLESESDSRQKNQILNANGILVNVPNELITQEQLSNRRRLSISHGMALSESNIAKHIETHQLQNQRRLTVVSAFSDQDEVLPSDAEPMKLVQEDQSIHYKVPAIMSYLRAGWGVIITLIIFAYFFLVHVVRILSGK